MFRPRHPITTLLGIFVLAAVSAVVAGVPTPVAAQSTGECTEDPWPLRRALFMYTHSGLPTDLLDKIADRFDFAVEGYRPDIEYLINRNSRFEFVAIYNSLTDNYVGDDSEHQWLFDNAAQYGVSGEDAYLHFYEDSVVDLQGEQITIPGWNPSRTSSDPPASASSPEEARIPVYFKSLARRVTNFSTQAVRDLHLAYNVSRLNTPLIGGIHPGGIMFDNSANQALQVRVVSGGAVAEHPTHAQFNSSEFMDWYWMGGVKTFLAQLREYVDTNRAMFGNRQIHIIPNTANSPYIGTSTWEASYVEPPIGHVLALEFEYNPTRDFGANLPQVIYEKHTQAINAGVGIFETGYLFKGRGDLAGSFTDEEAVMNNVAGHWVHRADDAGAAPWATTYLLGANVWDAASDQQRWELNLLPIFDVDLGRPLGPPFLLAEGTDGKGYSYRVYGRRFHCGMAVVRHRDPYDGDFDAATAVQFDLDGEYIPVDANGNLMPATTTWTLRNGQGQVFLNSGNLRDTLAPAPPENLRPE